MTTNQSTGVEEKFSLFQDALKRRYGVAVFDSYMSDLMIDDLSPDSVTLATTSAVKADRLNQQYRPAMLTVWNDRVFNTKNMIIVSRPTLLENSRKAAQKAISSLAQAPELKNRPTKQPVASPAKAEFDTEFANGFGGNGRTDAWEQDAEIDHRPLKTRSSTAGTQRPNTDDAPMTEACEAKAIGENSQRDKDIDFNTLATPIDHALTFDAFAIGASNEMAYAASRRIFLDSARREIVYLHGPSGCGKSHLLSAMAHEWGQRHPDRPVSYFSYTAMRDGCSSAAMSSSLHEFHETLNSQHLVLIDDIHLLKTCKRTQEEILNLANIFPSTKRQLVIAGECSPSKLVELGFNKRLADRLAGGLSASVAPGDEALRLDILRKRLVTEDLACDIEDDVLAFIAREFSSSIRVAIGALNQLILFYGQKPENVGLEAARERLRSKLEDQPRPATIESALEVTAEVFHLSVDDLKGRAQPQAIVRGRHAFVMVGREALKESFPRLGKALKRDHTTAMSGYDRAQALYERDDNFKGAVKKIRSFIGLPE